MSKRERPIKYKGAVIALVMVPRYEVRRAVDGKKFRTFGSLKTAKAFIVGFAAGADAYSPKAKP